MLRSTVLVATVLVATVLVATVLVAATASITRADSLLPASWEQFAGCTTGGASFAWAGEDETSPGLASPALAAVDAERDVELMTGLAAPEPPAIVLAGMAIGGMVCGRSMLRKRRVKAGGEGCA